MESKKNEIKVKEGSMYGLDFSNVVPPEHDMFTIKSGDEVLMITQVSKN